MVVSVVGGTGNLGFGIVLRLAKAGEEVIIGSRDTARAADSARKARDTAGAPAKVSGATNRDAAARGDIVIVTVPLPAIPETLREVVPAMKRSAVLVDVTNPLAWPVGDDPTNSLGLVAGSAAQFAASFVAGKVAVVGAFKEARSTLLRDLSRDFDSDLIVCSDNDAARSGVMKLIRKIKGARPIDGGPLANCRYVEHMVSLFLKISIRHDLPWLGYRFTVPPGSSI